MSNPCQYSQESGLVNGLNYLLKIFYLNNPDELGTMAYWHGLIKELYLNYGWKRFFNNERFEIWHWNHPDLLNYLKDYDLDATNGEQRACGININDFVACGIDPNNSNYSSDEYKNGVLSHEFWHSIGGAWGMGNTNQSFIQVLIWNEFARLLNIVYTSETINISNIYEKWAECGKALFGTKLTRDKFSDNKIFQSSKHPDIWTLMKLGECLSDTLCNDHITNLEIHSSVDASGNIWGYIVYLHHHWTLWWDNPVWEAIDTNFNLYQGNDLHYVKYLNT
jgi:hypothetical protein